MATTRAEGNRYSLTHLVDDPDSDELSTLVPDNYLLDIFNLIGDPATVMH